MKKLLDFLGTTLVGGLLVLAPIYLLFLLLLKAIGAARQLLDPIVAGIPAAATLRVPLALLLVVAACFVAGLLLRTEIGRRSVDALQHGVLGQIPGYNTLRTMLTRITGTDDGTDAFAPALVEIEEALVPAVIVEDLPDGQFVVLVPSVPTPFAGALYVLPAARVHRVDIPLKNLLQLYARWGAGTGEMVAAYRRTQASGST
jgi:uncharacterized membrane protein